MTDINMLKRVKKFTKDLSIYSTNPFYEDIKQLYKNDLIKTITSAENALKKIRVTKKGTIDKRSNKQVENINKLKDEFKQIQDEKKRQAVIKRKETIQKKKEIKEAKKLSDKSQSIKYFKQLEAKMKLLKSNIIDNVHIVFDDYRKYNISNKEFVLKFINIINRTNKDEKLLLRIDNLFYALNDHTKQRLFNYLKDNVVENNDNNKSDDEYFIELEQREEMTVSKIINKAKYKKSSGEFFRYLNKTDINLTEYQIYNKEQFNEVEHEDACLYYALEKLKLNVEKLNELKLFVKNRNIPMCDLNKICDKLQIKINIKKYCDGEERNRVLIYGKNYEEVYNIGLVEEHYFCIKETNYTAYSINNYDKIKDIENFNKIINDKNEKKCRFIDSFVYDY